MKTIINVNQIFSQREPKGKLSKVLLFPLTRIVIAILFLIPAYILHNIFVELVLSGIAEPLNTYVFYFETSLFIALQFYLYSLYTKHIENRKALEFNLKGWHSEFGKGLLIGGGSIVFLVLLF